MINLPFKLSHRLQENIWYHKKLSSRQYKKIKLLFKKNTSRKQSDFSKKLLQWKKLAFFYSTLSLNTNKTLNKLFSQKDKKKSLLLNLETRIDVLLVRLYFCSTLPMARQLINHKQVCVNFQTINVPRFHVKNGDIISIKPNILNQKTSLSSKSTKTENPMVREEKKQAFGNLDPTGKLQENFLLRGQNKLEGPAYGLVPNHIEVNYKTFHAVLLYEPTQIHFPYKIDLDFLF